MSVDSNAGEPMRLEGIASGYWTRFAKPSSGLISHCSSILLPSVGALDDNEYSFPQSKMVLPAFDYNPRVVLSLTILKAGHNLKLVWQTAVPTHSTKSPGVMNRGFRASGLLSGGEVAEVDLSRALHCPRHAHFRIEAIIRAEHLP